MTTQELTERLAYAIIDHDHGLTTDKEFFIELKSVHADSHTSNLSVVYPTTSYTHNGYTKNFSLESNRVISITIDDTFEVTSNNQLANSIRLGPNTNFNNFTFRINISSSTPPLQPFVFFSLFTWYGRSEGNPQPELKGRDVDMGDFRNYPELNSGTYLLTLRDRTPWTIRNLSDVESNFFRKDVILIKNGVAQNRPIAPYDTMATNLEWNSFALYQTGQRLVKNVTLERNRGCVQNIILLKVIHEDDVLIENVTIASYGNAAQVITGDCAFQVMDSTNIKFNHIMINHVFSSENAYGYGINLDNVWNVEVADLQLPYPTGTPVWGIFGNNNVNTLKLADCHLNRFDIHCYGRDVICEGCTFEAANNSTKHNINRLSSFFGEIRFKGCTFTNFLPLRIDPDFNAYTGFDIYFEDGCVLTYRPSQNYLVEMWYLRDDEINHRPELRQKCWPNIYIDDLSVNANLTSFQLYGVFPPYTYPYPIGYLSWIDVHGLHFNSITSSSVLQTASTNLSTNNYLHINSGSFGNAFVNTFVEPNL